MNSGTPARKVPNSGGATYVTNQVIATKAVKLVSLAVYNSGAAKFIQLHETATLPADGAVPAYPPIAIAGTTFLVIDFGNAGVDFDALTICNSSTGPTKTIGAADCAIVATVIRG